MPIVTASAVPLRGYVIVQVNVSDVPGNPAVRLWRRTVGQGPDQLVTTTIAADGFARMVAGGWGTADYGGAWTADAGAAGDYTSGSGATQVNAAVSTRHRMVLASVNATDVDIVVPVLPHPIALGSYIEAVTVGRRQDANNMYVLGVRFNADASVTAVISRRVGGVTTLINSAAVPGLTYTAASKVMLRTSIAGSTLAVKAWLSTATEPTAWALNLTDPTAAFATAGSIGLSSILDAANTNVLPFPVSFGPMAATTSLVADETQDWVRPNTYSYSAAPGTFLAGDSYMVPSGGDAIFYDTEAPLDMPFYYIAGTVDRTTGVVTNYYTIPKMLSSETILGSSGDLWLKDPLHPWKDRRVTLIQTAGPQCIPGYSIFFGAMQEEARATRNTSFVVQDRARPVVTTRVRGSVGSTLNLVGRTFPDRDAVIDLTSTGAALFLQAPVTYGLPQRYMTVGDVVVSRLSSDHRRPWRALALPFQEVDQPLGNAYGVLGVRWNDICDRYPTFASAAAAGLTWEQVMLGAASYPPLPVSAFRTYAVVKTEFANYTAVAAGGRTYEGLLEGS